MKKLILILTILFALSAMGLGQKKSDEQTLIKMEQEFLEAIVGKKFSTLEKYYANTYVLTTPDGVTIPKSDLFVALKGGALNMESSTNSAMKVYLYGTTAIVTYTSTDKGQFNGAPINGKFRWTDTFVKMKGKWMLAATQGTPIVAM